jgi:hypothetical protein
LTERRQDSFACTPPGVFDFAAASAMHLNTLTQREAKNLPNSAYLPLFIWPRVTKRIGFYQSFSAI